MGNKIQFLIWVLSSVVLAACQSKSTENVEVFGKRLTSASNPALKDGDIIFQTSTSSQSEAIQLATHSQYSHVGIVYEDKGSFYVFEAVQPVKLTPLNDWIKHGKTQHYVVKRLKNADAILTTHVLNKMKSIGERYKGKPYDIYFEWSDERIYCSELVWKIYKEAAGIEIGQLSTLSDFDLNSDTVKQLMRERYGNKIPMNEKVISPSALFESEELVEVINVN